MPSYLSSVLRLVIKRIANNPGLTLATAIGLVAAIAVVVGISVYADGLADLAFEDQPGGEDGRGAVEQ